MSLNAILGAAVSGVHAAQTGLKVTSDNIANVDTLGYVRKVAVQESYISGFVGAGVSVATIKLAADRFLQMASLTATSHAGRAAAAGSLWNQAQGLFGDPSEDTSFFSSLDRAFAAFSTLAAVPTSSAARAGALDQAAEFFNRARSVSDQLQGLRDQADARIAAGVEKANQLLAQIDALNVEISRARAMSNDSTGPENKQIQLIDELALLIDIKTSPRPEGGVSIRASDGLPLAGGGAAVLTYERTGAVGEISVRTSGGPVQLLGGRLQSGELKGLLNLRNDELPALSAQLAELVSQTADQLNRVHNAHSAVPAPPQLVGRNTGLDSTSAFSGFGGRTTVALLDTAGVVQRRIDIDFDAGELSVDGGPAAAFTPATFVAVLDAALAPMGGAGFSGGALTLSGAGGLGVAVQDDPSDPSLKAGRSFSAFLGLNDLVRSTGFPHYDTGLAAADAHGFLAGGEITFRMMAGDGSRITDIKVAVPAGATMADLLTALNAPAGGVGLYGAFSLDTDGQLAFAASAGSGYALSVVDDQTQRGVGGPSLSSFFGLGETIRAGRAGSFSLRADIAQNPSRLALARLDLAAAPGTSSLSPGDTRGADALARAGQAMTAFNAAGSVGAVTQKLSDYAAGLSGHVARKAANAETARDAALAVAVEATARRSSTEGVNLDQELIHLTTYQQAYNASARMIQAVREMYDVLLAMTK